MAPRPNPVSRPRTRPGGLWREAGIEPRLPDVLSDPLVHQVMRRDGVTSGELASVIAQAQMKLRRGFAALPRESDQSSTTITADERHAPPA